MKSNEELKPGDIVRLDLPHYCLEPDPAESKRALAWVNSICLVFLVIGLLGLKPPAPVIHKKAPIAEETVPTIVEPLVTEVQTIAATQNSDEPPGEPAASEGSAAVAVTLDSPAVAFSVPTVGNVLVPLAVAQAPPVNPLQPAAKLSTPHFERIGVTGAGGGRPAPPYPEDALQRKEEGRVLLFIEVDESGKITSVTIRESSGHPQLDRVTLDYVKRHWFFAPADGPRQYEAPIIYRISTTP